MLNLAVSTQVVLTATTTAFGVAHVRDLEPPLVSTQPTYIATTHKNVPSPSTKVELSLRQRVADLRETSGLSTKQLAALFGVSRRSVHNWINGHRMAKRHEERLSYLEEEIRALPGETPDEKREALFYSVEKKSKFRELKASIPRAQQLQISALTPLEMLQV